MVFRIHSTVPNIIHHPIMRWHITFQEGLLGFKNGENQKSFTNIQYQFVSYRHFVLNRWIKTNSSSSFFFMTDEIKCSGNFFCLETVLIYLFLFNMHVALLVWRQTMNYIKTKQLTDIPKTFTINHIMIYDIVEQAVINNHGRQISSFKST